LQAVGKATHGALEGVQLLVEVTTEPGQFIGLAQVFGVDYFVERWGVCAVGGSIAALIRIVLALLGSTARFTVTSHFSTFFGAGARG
jgi:hypothetical protein